jgi:3' terminal RNA ribose 2'-O-methyltransferase Hen1
MYLSIATTHSPATDLGFLLMKNPSRLHEIDLSFGKASLFYPQASEERCEAVLCLNIDPVGLVRGRGTGSGLLSQYVNDRPYAATSFLAVALNKMLRTAMAGNSKDRPDLAAKPIPLEIHLTPLPAPGGESRIKALFEPLGWQVETSPVSGSPRYLDVYLTGNQKLSEALKHLYVLIPSLDNDKHYWVGDDEVEKLLTKGDPWLATHPEKDWIALRYLKHRRSLASDALARLLPEVGTESDTPSPHQESRETKEDALERPLRLNDVRIDAVLAVLSTIGAKSVADLGCGEGKVLSRLARDRRLTQIFGLDASTQALSRAHQRLKLGLAGGEDVDRVRLLHGALTLTDKRWAQVDAALLVEVIEHLDPERLPALEAVLFARAASPHHSNNTKCRV